MIGVIILVRYAHQLIGKIVEKVTVPGIIFMNFHDISKLIIIFLKPGYVYLFKMKINLQLYIAHKYNRI